MGKTKKAAIREQSGRVKLPLEPEKIIQHSEDRIYLGFTKIWAFPPSKIRLHHLNPLALELVNFNPLARDKYTVLSENYALSAIDTIVPPEQMNRLRRIITDTGATVRLESA